MKKKILNILKKSNKDMVMKTAVIGAVGGCLFISFLKVGLGTMLYIGVGLIAAMEAGEAVAEYILL